VVTHWQWHLSFLWNIGCPIAYHEQMDGHRQWRITIVIVILYFNLEEMQNYADFRKSIRDFLLLNPSPSPADTVAILERLENQVFDICSSLGSKIDEKNNDLIKTLKERIPSESTEFQVPIYWGSFHQSTCPSTLLPVCHKNLVGYSAENCLSTRVLVWVLH